MKGNGYSFVPVKGSWKWAEANYKVQGTPSNFLLDGKGRVYFRPSVHDPATQKTLEQQVEALLARGNGG